MEIKHTFFFLFCFLPFSSNSQGNNGIEERFLKNVVHISIPEKNAIGTGFLVSVKIDSVHKVIYLVTNKHLVGEFSIVDSYIPYDSIVVDFYANPHDTPFPKTIKIKGNNFVYIHPDSKTDVAVINITKIYIDNPDIKSYAVDSSFLQRIDSLPNTGIGLGSQVFGIGYPADIMIAGTNEPIGKSGYIASSLSGKLEIKTIVKNRFGDNINTTIGGSFFLVDGLLIGGNSGQSYCYSYRH